MKMTNSKIEIAENLAGDIRELEVIFSKIITNKDYNDILLKGITTDLIKADRLTGTYKSKVEDRFKKIGIKDYNELLYVSETEVI